MVADHLQLVTGSLEIICFYIQSLMPIELLLWQKSPFPKKKNLELATDRFYRPDEGHVLSLTCITSEVHSNHILCIL